VLLIFSISTPIFAVLTPDQTKEARRIWLNGYDYFDKGSKALDSGQLRQAHTLFKESIKIFNDIKTKYPGWSSSMIGYRLKLCKSKIEQVEKLLASKNIKLTDTDVDKENIVLKKDLKKLKRTLNWQKENFQAP
jgi:actin-related protein